VKEGRVTMAKRIRNVKELSSLREDAKAEIDLRTGAKATQITVHMGTCGIAAGARDILTEFAGELTRGSIGNVTLRQSGCFGMCAQEPMITVTDKSGKEFRYGNLDKAKVHRIVREHILGASPVAEYLITT